MEERGWQMRGALKAEMMEGVEGKDEGGEAIKRGMEGWGVAWES